MKSFFEENLGWMSIFLKVAWITLILGNCSMVPVMALWHDVPGVGKVVGSYMVFALFEVVVLIFLSLFEYSRRRNY